MKKTFFFIITHRSASCKLLLTDSSSRQQSLLAYAIDNTLSQTQFGSMISSQLGLNGFISAHFVDCHLELERSGTMSSLETAVLSVKYALDNGPISRLLHLAD